MQSLIVTLAILAVVVALFMLFRAVVLWYWKIDRIAASLENIERHLKNLNAPSVTPAIPPVSSGSN